MNRPAVTQAEVHRAIKGAERAGKTVRAVTLRPGEVRVEFELLDGLTESPETHGPKAWPAE